MQRRAECTDGTEIEKGKQSLSGCADACRDQAEVFVLGTNDFGQNRCDGKESCECYCELGTKNSKCQNIIKHDGFDLYRFNGNSLVITLFVFFSNSSLK